MKLGSRLMAIASLVPAGAIVADIGSDHGLLLEYLLQQNRIFKGYATDNKAGPYQRLIKRFQDEPRVSVYQADGLSQLPDDVNAIVIAGLGGLLINRILETGKALLQRLPSIILSPHQQVFEVRLMMMQRGFRITEEIIVVEDGHCYDIIHFTPGMAVYNKEELLYGPINLRKHPPELVKKMLNRRDEIKRLLDKNLPETRKETLIAEKEWLHHYDQNL